MCTAAHNISLSPSHRPRGRWAERAESGPIKTLPETDPRYFTPFKSQLEGDAELEPGSLERLLSEVSRPHAELREAGLRF